MKTLEAIKSFVAFDVETATSKRNSICQIGLAEVKDLKIVSNNSFLVQPPKNEYLAINSSIHGITALETKDKPTFPTIWNKIESDFELNVLVAHNASFDMSALLQTLDFYKIDAPKFKVICTYQMTKLNLQALCDSLQIILDDHHNAVSDAVACASAMINILNGNMPDHSLIKSHKKNNFFEFEGHERLCGDILKPNLDVEDKDNPFYSKKVVLTGVLKSMSRKEAAQILKDKGADIDSCVTKKTKYVIVGAEAGPSKLKQIEKLNFEGAEIQIIEEERFLSMVK